MTNKEKYKRICAENNIPLFSQAWWIEAASVDKDWDVVMVENSDGVVVGALPYHVKTKWHQRLVLMPQHTQHIEPWISPQEHTSDVLGQLLYQWEQVVRLEHMRYVYMQSYLSEARRKVYEARHYTLSTRQSFRIDTSKPEKDIVAAFSKNKRRQLRHAEGLRLCTIDGERFYEFHRACLRKRGKEIDYSFRFLQSVYQASSQHEQGTILAAVNEQKTILAAIFLVWDSQTCYYLLPTYDLSYTHTGAMAWLTLQAILFAKNKGLVFDFEGSMNPTIALSYAQFGATQSVYYGVEKGSVLSGKLMSWWSKIREVL